MAAWIWKYSNLIQCATGNLLNIFLSNIGRVSFLKTFPSYSGPIFEFKVWIWIRVLKPNSNSNSCWLATTNSLNILSISGHFGSYTLLRLVIIFIRIIGLLFSPPKLINQNKGTSGLQPRNNKLERNILSPTSCGRATINPLSKFVISNSIGSRTYFSL